MNQSASKQFHAALTHLLAKEGRGVQSRLAREQNIDRGYMNAIAKGRKSGAEDIRSKIAAYFRMTYEEMLILGRTILDGGDIAQKGTGDGGGKGQDNRRPKATSKENGVLEFLEPQKKERPQLSIAEKITKAVAILESDSKYREVLSGLIDAFYEAVSIKKDNLSSQNKMRELESRITELENQAYAKDEVRKSA